jgi:hypothetical protein
MSLSRQTLNLSIIIQLPWRYAPYIIPEWEPVEILEEGVEIAGAR